MFFLFFPFIENLSFKNFWMQKSFLRNLFSIVTRNILCKCFQKTVFTFPSPWSEQLGTYTIQSLYVFYSELFKIVSGNYSKLWGIREQLSDEIDKIINLKLYFQITTLYLWYIKQQHVLSMYAVLMFVANMCACVHLLKREVRGSGLYSDIALIKICFIFNIIWVWIDRGTEIYLPPNNKLKKKAILA